MEAPLHQRGFSGADRHIVEEDEIRLTSVGVDIGSSTSHLVFSRLELKQENIRYVVKRRTVLNESEILLTSNGEPPKAGASASTLTTDAPPCS